MSFYRYEKTSERLFKDMNCNWNPKMKSLSKLQKSIMQYFFFSCYELLSNDDLWITWLLNSLFFIDSYLDMFSQNELNSMRSKFKQFRTDIIYKSFWKYRKNSVFVFELKFTSLNSTFEVCLYEWKFGTNTDHLTKR